MRVRFGDCTLDTDARRLARSGVDVHLSPKAFELLMVLVASRGRAVSKSELLDRVWKGVAVTDASLTRAVNEIRDAIGDRAHGGSALRTVHGFGYAWEAAVQPELAAVPPRARQAGCWLIAGRRTFALADGEHLAGRDSDVAIRLDSPRVSRRHARVIVRGTQATVEDLRSKNGTFVGGRRIEKVTTLSEGDEVRIGPYTLVFRKSRGCSTTQTETESS